MTVFSSSVTHPSGIIEINNYNSSGYLSSVSTGGVGRWTTNGMNARRQVTLGQYGNNLNATYGYDNYGYPSSTVTGTIQDYSYNFNTVTGNLNWRQNNKYTNLREDFQYDNLDRLVNVHMDTTMTLSMAYDSNKGGITTKSDAGTLKYETSGKPYAVSSIDPSTGLTPDSTQSVTYTSFASVNTISENNYNASFTYNSDNDRAQMIVQQGSGTILTRWYPSDSYIKETAGSVTKEYTFIGGDEYTAPVVAITQNDTTTYYNLLRDYLGSITHVVNSATNAVVAEYSYDAWGRMRHPSAWVNYTPGSEPALFVAGRGFTGHEHLPWFNLINMNGRVYDPLIAVFLSPDPYVQQPRNSQSYNRYSYCINNPLMYTDPNGQWFGWDDLVAAVVGAVVGYVGYGITTGDWGHKAFAAAGVGAGIAWVGWNTMGAGTEALAHGAGSATSFWEGTSAVFGSASGSYGTQFAVLTALNVSQHGAEITAGDRKGWGGVLAFAGYSASAVLSTSLDPTSITKAVGLRQWAGVVLTDNISANMKDGEFKSSSYHIGILGYNFDNNKGYSIFSKGLSGDQRFDMGFETVLGLSLIKTDIEFKYRIPRVDNCGTWNRGLQQLFTMNTAFIGYYSNLLLGLSDDFFEAWKQQTTFEYWYDQHYNDDGTVKN